MRTSLLRDLSSRSIWSRHWITATPLSLPLVSGASSLAPCCSPSANGGQRRCYWWRRRPSRLCPTCCASSRGSLQGDDAARPGTGGEWDPADQGRAVGILTRPAVVQVGAGTLDEQAERRRVSVGEGRDEHRLLGGRVFPNSGSHRLHDADRPG